VVACLDDEQLLALLEHRLPEDAVAKVQEHIDGCDQCRAMVADVIGADVPTVHCATPAVAVATPTTALPRGTAIGRYVLLELVGRGGMGMVYSAYDRELDRRVALKLVRADSRVSRDLDQRLVREAQALARVSHPNVVHVYEVGMWNEQLFIAMEWVDGATLSSWLRERSRSRREILATFMAAGRGLAAVHAVGLVHRDFKPDNVMIGRDERARVTDFGLARPAGLPGPSTDASPDSPLYRELTAAGAVVGTPGYMAPEQFRGEATDARSDLFSFCVAVYEALTGVRPFSGGSRKELLAAIDKGELAPGRIMELPRELRRTLARGLSARPEARHASMEALLAELAYDPGVRRRRWLSAGPALTLIIVGALGWHQLDRRHSQVCRGADLKLSGIWDSPERTRIHQVFAASQLSYAEPVWQSVAGALDDYARRWTAMYTQSCEETRLRGEQSEEVMQLRMECLERRRGSLRALVDVFERADAKVVEGAVRAAQDLASLDECRNADALRQVVRPPADAKARAAVGAIRAQLANAAAQVQAGHYDDAGKLADAALADARAVGYAPALAEALYWHGRVDEGRGNEPAAADTLFAAAAAAEAGRDDHQRALSYADLVFVLGPMLSRYAEAQGCSSVGRAALLRAGGDAALEARFDSYEAMLLSLQGRHDEAIAAQTKVVARLEQIWGANSDRVAAAYHNLGAQYEIRNDHPHAIQCYEHALAIYDRVYGQNHPARANTLAHLGEIWFEDGDTTAAMNAFSGALTIRERVLGPKHPDVAFSLTNVATALIRQGQLDKARAALDRAQQIQNGAPPNPQLAYYELTSAWLYLRLNQLEVALNHAQHALQLSEQMFGKEHSSVAEALTWIGRIRVAHHQYGEAFAPLERAITIFEHHPADEPQYLAQARFALAMALWDSGRARARARTLAVSARGQLVDDRAELESWLAQRKAPDRP
jgi:serine/threonine protein kinase/tetratricopeptide (TPR) repeat protein